MRPRFFCCEKDLHCVHCGVTEREHKAHRTPNGLVPDSALCPSGLGHFFTDSPLIASLLVSHLEVAA